MVCPQHDDQIVDVIVDLSNQWALDVVDIVEIGEFIPRVRRTFQKMPGNQP